MFRWSNRHDLRRSLREHSWIWKAPFLTATVAIWVGAVVLFVGPWQGGSNTPDRVRTLPSPVSVEPDDTAGERRPAGVELSATGFTDDSSGTSDLAVDDQSGGAADTTETGSAPPTDSVLEVGPGLDSPITTEVGDDTARRPSSRSSSTTPAPPTVTSTAPAPPTVTTLPPRPPTVTVARPTTRPPSVTIPRPTAPPTTPPATTSPPVTQPPTVPTTVPAETAPPTSAAPAPPLP